MCIVGKIAQDVGMVLKCCGVIPIWFGCYKLWKGRFRGFQNIGQTFLATFRSDPDLLQAYNSWDTDQNARYK